MCVCVLVSLDINSVYKIIPNNKGIETIHETLNVQQKTKQHIRTTPAITIFLTFILTLKISYLTAKLSNGHQPFHENVLRKSHISENQREIISISKTY